MTTYAPHLHRRADRSYTLVEPHNIGALRQYLEAHGGRHMTPRPGDLYTHRWTFDSKAGRTIVSLFPSGNLVALGPAVALLDELVECEGVL
jgi:hypothetical protein